MEVGTKLYFSWLGKVHEVFFLEELGDPFLRRTTYLVKGKIPHGFGMEIEKETHILFDKNFWSKSKIEAMEDGLQALEIGLRRYKSDPIKHKSNLRKTKDGIRNLKKLLKADKSPEPTWDE